MLEISEKVIPEVEKLKKRVYELELKMAKMKMKMSAKKWL